MHSRIDQLRRAPVLRLRHKLSRRELKALKLKEQLARADGVWFPTSAMEAQIVQLAPFERLLITSRLRRRYGRARR